MLAPAVGSGAPVRDGNGEMSPLNSYATHLAEGILCEYIQKWMAYSALFGNFVNCVVLNKCNRANASFILTYVSVLSPSKVYKYHARGAKKSQKEMHKYEKVIYFFPRRVTFFFFLQFAIL